METFQWNNAYNTNIPEVDEQHKYLVCLIQELYFKVKKQDFHTKTSEILNELRDYSIQHFSLEETSFFEMDEEYVINHKKQHSIFIEKINDLIQTYESNAFFDIEVLNFLRNWLMNHIMVVDKKITTSEF